MQNVVAAVFDVESEGYQAITSLKKDAVKKSYTILQMALVKREGDKIAEDVSALKAKVEG